MQNRQSVHVSSSFCHCSNLIYKLIKSFFGILRCSVSFGTFKSANKIYSIQKRGLIHTKLMWNKSPNLAILRSNFILFIVFESNSIKKNCRFSLFRSKVFRSLAYLKMADKKSVEQFSFAWNLCATNRTFTRMVSVRLSKIEWSLCLKTI